MRPFLFSLAITAIVGISVLAVYGLFQMSTVEEEEREGGGGRGGADDLSEERAKPSPDIGQVKRPFLSSEKMAKHLELMERRYKKSEKDWEEKIREVFLEQYRLDEETVEKYFELRDVFEREQWEAFQEFISEREREGGGNFRFNPTEMEDAISEKLKRGQLQRVVKLIGKENTPSFIEMRDKFNEENGLDETDMAIRF